MWPIVLFLWATASCMVIERAHVDENGLIGVDEFVAILGHLGFIDMVAVRRTSKQIQLLVDQKYPKRRLNVSQYSSMVNAVIAKEDLEAIKGIVDGGFWNLGCVIDLALLHHEHFINYPFLIQLDDVKRPSFEILEYLLDHSFEPIDFRFIVDCRNSHPTPNKLPMAEVGCEKSLLERSSVMNFFRRHLLFRGKYGLLVKMIEFGYPAYDETGSVLHEALHIHDQISCLNELLDCQKICDLVNIPNAQGNLPIDLLSVVDAGLTIKFLRAGAIIKKPTVIANTIALCPVDLLPELVHTIIDTMKSSGIDPRFSDRNGCTLLYNLVYVTADRELIKKMIDAGFDPEQNDVYGRTPSSTYLRIHGEKLL